MHRQRWRLCRIDVRKAFGFPSGPQMDLRGYASLTSVAILIGFLILATSVSAQRQRAATTANSLPSPRSVFGFNPGDDRTIIDWKQITDYLTQLDKASDRVQLQ
ncbi:MAG TPA: hypothetical protein VLN44_12375, partial [Pyrinomonadaceae bacterium]|nr:hypothetical protein [Pyrinomonadaceae bacterium]